MVHVLLKPTHVKSGQYASIVLLTCASETAFWQYVHLFVSCASSVTAISYRALKVFWDYFVRCAGLVISLGWETSKQINSAHSLDRGPVSLCYFFLSWVWTYRGACETLQSTRVWDKVYVKVMLFRCLSDCAWLVTLRSISACSYGMVNNGRWLMLPKGGSASVHTQRPHLFTWTFVNAYDRVHFPI